LPAPLLKLLEKMAEASPSDALGFGISSSRASDAKVPRVVSRPKLPWKHVRCASEPSWAWAEWAAEKALLPAGAKPKTAAEVTNAEILQTLQKVCRHDSGGNVRAELAQLVACYGFPPQLRSKAWQARANRLTVLHCIGWTRGDGGSSVLTGRKVVIPTMRGYVSLAQCWHGASEFAVQIVSGAAEHPIRKQQPSYAHSRLPGATPYTAQNFRPSHRVCH
jgi:hypothetical protein